MKGRKQKKLISGVLVVVLMMSFAPTALATDIQNAKDKEQQLEDQRQETEAEKEAISAKLRALSVSMQEATEKLAVKKEEIEAAEQDLIMAQIEEDTQYESMKLRIQYMYEYGNVSLIQIFLESDSISDFLSKAEYIIMMSKYDREKLNDFQRAVEQVEEKELALQVEYQELTELQNSIAAQREEAETLLSQKSSELDELDLQISAVKEQIKKAEEAEKKRKEAEEAERKRQEEEERRRQEEEEKKNQNQNQNNNQQTGGSTVIVGNGYFTHPCPGMTYQSSYFGEVREGIGDPTPHKGHDYAAPEGTPIYAAQAGKVVTAGYSYSAGYWVVINHGNGLVTKYMHMFEMPYVSAGDTVVKGQHIGGVGTTGQSTGNHLHFQVEENGVPVNPSKYL